MEEKIFQLVYMIPYGKVASYKDISSASSIFFQTSFGPRQVGSYLKKLDIKNFPNLPWHRVVASTGKISSYKIGNMGKTQENLLNTEGVETKNQKVNMKKYRYNFFS